VWRRSMAQQRCGSTKGMSLQKAAALFCSAVLLCLPPGWSLAR